MHPDVSENVSGVDVVLPLDLLLYLETIEVALGSLLAVSQQVIDISDAVEGAGGIIASFPLHPLLNVEAHGVVLKCLLVLTHVLVGIP
jgi:hypothetical protein